MEEPIVPRTHAPQCPPGTIYSSQRMQASKMSILSPTDPANLLLTYGGRLRGHKRE